VGVRQDHSVKAQAVQRVGQRAPPAQEKEWLAGAAFEPPVWAMNHQMMKSMSYSESDKDLGFASTGAEASAGLTG